MGLGSLKFLLSKEGPSLQGLRLLLVHLQPPLASVSQLLGGVYHASGGNDLFFINHASVIYHHLSSPALTFVPTVLGAVATKVSLLMTGVTLNFAHVSSGMTWSLSPSLKESSAWGVSSWRYVSSTHCPGVCLFTSSNSPPCSS